MTLQSLNHALQSYNTEAHALLQDFQNSVPQMGPREWRRIESAFRDVRSVFAEYNKWDCYGIALSFKDFDLHDGERLISFNGAMMPWHGRMADTLERRLVPRCVRAWEGRIEASSFQLLHEDSCNIYDIAFERAALSRLGGLSLVRLERALRPEEGLAIEVEGLQGGVVVSYPLAASRGFLLNEDLIPIMWEFRRFWATAGDIYKIVATRFRRPAEIAAHSPSITEFYEPVGMHGADYDRPNGSNSSPTRQMPSVRNT